MILEINVSVIYPEIKNPSSPDDFDRWEKEFNKLMEPYNELDKKLKQHPVYSFSGMFMYLEHYRSDMFYYFLEQAKELNGHQFHFKVYLEKDEKNEIDAFIMKANKDFPLTYDCTNLLSSNDVPFFNPEFQYPIRIVKELRLKKFTKINANRIYEDSNGFIVSSELANRFKETNLTGYEIISVKDCGGRKEQDNMYCLIAENILPSSEKNILRYEWQEKGEQNITLPYNGTLIYREEAFQNIKDFNYPCEATHRDGRTDMIVSRKFKEFCEKENIKGVDFIPVFTKESQLYQEYVTLVKELCKDLIKSNPKNKIGYSNIDPIDIIYSL